MSQSHKRLGPISFTKVGHVWLFKAWRLEIAGINRCFAIGFSRT